MKIHIKWHAKTLRITSEKVKGLTEFATCVSKLCKCLLSIYLLSYLTIDSKSSPFAYSCVYIPLFPCKSCKYELYKHYILLVLLVRCTYCISIRVTYKLPKHYSGIWFVEKYDPLVQQFPKAQVGQWTLPWVNVLWLKVAEFSKILVNIFQERTSNKSAKNKSELNYHLSIIDTIP